MAGTPKLGAAIDGRISDFMDSYVIVGFVSGNPTPLIIRRDGGDPKTALALNSLLAAAITAAEAHRHNTDAE